MGQANTLAIGLISNLLKPRYAPALHSSPEPEPQRQMASSAAPPEATLYPRSLKQFLRSPPPPQSRAEAHYGGSLSHFFPRGCVKVLNPLPAPERRTWAPWPCSPGVTRGGGGGGGVGSQPGGERTDDGENTYQHPGRRDWWQREACPLRAEVSPGTAPRHRGR